MTVPVVEHWAVEASKTEIGGLAETLLLGAIVLVLPDLAAVAAVEGARLPDLASPGAIMEPAGRTSPRLMP